MQPIRWSEVIFLEMKTFLVHIPYKREIIPDGRVVGVNWKGLHHAYVVAVDLLMCYSVNFPGDVVKNKK